MKFTVHSKSHLDVILLGADVHVTGPFPHRLGENGVDKPDNRCFLDHILKGTDFNIIREIGFFRFGLLFDLHFLNNTTDARIGTVKAANEMIELLISTDNRFNFSICVYLQGIQRRDIHRINHGNCQQKTTFHQRCNLVFRGHIHRNILGKAQIDRVFFRAVFFNLQLNRNQVHDLVSADVAFPDQVLPQFQLGLFVTHDGFFKLYGC